MTMKPVDRMEQIVRESRDEIQAKDSMTHNAPSKPPIDTRRSFLRSTMAMAGGVGALGLAGRSAIAAPLAIPESNKQMGRPLPPEDYGMPSKYEAKV